MKQQDQSYYTFVNAKQESPSQYHVDTETNKGKIDSLENFPRFYCLKSNEKKNTERTEDRPVDQKMDVSRKNTAERKHCSSPEPKKESRLTSIIDQLRINKTKDAASPETKNKPGDNICTQALQDQLEKSNDLVGDHRSEETRGQQSPVWSPCDMPTDAALSAASSNTGHNNNAAPKTDRGTPEPESSSSPSISPHSPSPARAFPSLLVPGFGLRVNSTAPFSPPPGLERFSPATGNPAIKQMEMMTRNYSDFMRSLAAKYNNTQDSFPTPQSNGMVRGFDSSFSYKSGAPYLVRNMDSDGNSSGCLSSTLSRKLDNQGSPTPVENRNSNNNSNNLNNSSAPVRGGVGACNISEFTSSQTLLNLVRTASAQSASQLENYLKGAVKRSAEGENRLDPLDLTIGAIKRPKLDIVSGRELKNCRDLFHSEAESALSTGSDGHGSLRTVSVSSTKPSWMSLLDKRMYMSPTSSLRTSPKIQNSERSRCVSLCVEKSCSSQSEASDLSHWTVDDVVKFVSSVETCSEYAEKFREESIDGTTLPLLTEDHLMMHLGLKLGPALKLRSTLARRIGHCAVCMHCVHCHGDESTDARRHESSRSPTVSK